MDDAFIGLAVAGYLTYVETQAVAAVCGPVGDCNAVQTSSYSKLFGLIPVGLIGMAGYVAILFTSYLVRGPFYLPGMSNAMSESIAPQAELPRLVARSQLNASLLIAFACVILVMILVPFITALLNGQGLRGLVGNESGVAKFVQGLMIEIFILALYALSYDLLLGITGLLSFGHAMFFAVGAYLTGIMLKSFAEAAQALQRADYRAAAIRCARFLPGRIFTSDIVVHPGTYNLSVEYLGADGGIIRTDDFPGFKVQRGKFNLLRVVSPE